MSRNTINYYNTDFTMDNELTIGKRINFQNGIAIGSLAGNTNQGTNAIAIGNQAGQTNQHANSIVLNATGTTLNTTTSSAMYAAPIRNASQTNALYYDNTTGEITYDTAGGPTTSYYSGTAVQDGSAVDIPYSNSFIQLQYNSEINSGFQIRINPTAPSDPSYNIKGFNVITSISSKEIQIDLTKTFQRFSEPRYSGWIHVYPTKDTSTPFL